MLLLSRIIRRLCAVTLTLVLFWLFLALLWTALPSPSYQPSTISSFVRNGKPTTLVYPSGTYFRWDEKAPSREHSNARMALRWYFGVEAQVHVQEDATESYVTVGGGHQPLDPNNKYIDTKLSSANISLIPWQFQQDPTTQTALGERFTVGVATGDDDGINLPWFNKADSAMLFWWLHFDEAEIPLRPRYVLDKRDNGADWVLLQIWPDTSYWSTISQEGLFTPPNLKPLFTIAVPPTTPTSDSTPSPSLEFTFPPEPDAYTLSKTYPVRVAVGALLVPLGLFGYYGFGFLFFLVTIPFAIAIQIVYLIIPATIAIIFIAAAFIFLQWIWVKPAEGTSRPSLLEFGKGMVLKWWRWSGLKVSFRVSRRKRRGPNSIGVGDEEGEGEDSVLLELEAGDMTPLPPLSTSMTLADPPHTGVLVDISEPTPRPRPDVPSSTIPPTDTASLEVTSKAGATS